MHNLTEVEIEKLADEAVLKMFGGDDELYLKNASYRDGFIDGIDHLKSMSELLLKEAFNKGYQTCKEEGVRDEIKTV